MYSILKSKAQEIADWLVTNTCLSFSQISDYCDISELTVKSIADGFISSKISSVNPIYHGLISQEELDRCSNSIENRIEKHYSFFDNHPEICLLSDGDPINDNLIHKFSIVKLYYVSYGRNAWHSTWIRRYYRNGSLCGNLLSAQLFAEKLRVQGSVFSIREIPAICLQSNNNTLIIAKIFGGELNSPSSLPKNMPNFIKKLSWYFDENYDDSVICTVVNGNIFYDKITNDQDFSLYESKPTSHGKPLYWKCIEMKSFDLQNYELLVSIFNHNNIITKFKYELIRILFPESVEFISNFEFYCEVTAFFYIKITVRLSNKERFFIAEINSLIKYLS